MLLGDIVAVNGKPAKGLLGDRIVTINTSQNAMPGQAIADVERSSIVELVWEIQQADGTPVGSIVALGFSGGSVSGLPPGAPGRVTSLSSAEPELSWAHGAKRYSFSRTCLARGV